MAARLTSKVFTAKRPGLTRDVPPGHEALEWVANAVTLVMGERDAVLVDTFLTIDQGRMLVDAIVATGKNLTAVYITHGHGDHFLGLAALRERFPQARFLALPKVVERMAAQVTPDYMASTWRKLFPGQIPESTPIASPLAGTTFELEGHALTAIPLGHTDTPDSTCLHVPAIDLVAAGDAVYGDIHVFLGESTRQSRLEWLAALHKIESLNPRVVVAGHKVPDGDDSPRQIEDTRRYLRDFIRLEESASTARQLFDAMMALHGARANPGALWSSALAAKR